MFSDVEDLGRNECKVNPKLGSRGFRVLVEVQSILGIKPFKNTDFSMNSYGTKGQVCSLFTSRLGQQTQIWVFLDFREFSIRFWVF